MSIAPELSSFVIRAGGFCETECPLVSHELDGKRLIVDGNWLAWEFYGNRDRKELADDSEENIADYEQQFKRFFSLITKSGAYRVLLAIQEEFDPLDTKISRSQQDSHPDPTIPQVAAKVIRSLASTSETRTKHTDGKESVMKVEIFEHAGSTHDHVGHVSNTEKCPILTGDGLFYARTPSRGLIPADSLSCGSLKIFKLDGLMNSCPPVCQNKLALINALIRTRSDQDPSGLRVTRSLRNRLTSFFDSSDCKRISNGRWNDRVLGAIWNHLRDKTYEGARDFIVRQAAPSDSVLVSGIIVEARMDLEFDRTARELREKLENICECQYHHRNRAAGWLELLHEQTRRPREISASMFRQSRATLDSVNQLAGDSSQLTDKNHRAILLRGLQSSTDTFDEQLELYSSNPNNKIVQEFLVVKLLLTVIDVENAEMMFSKEFKQATLSCLLYYLDGEGDGKFLRDFRAKLAEQIYHGGHKLRTPLKDISACSSNIIRQLRGLIELIGAFNELNSLSGYPMQAVRPEEWLNPCLIYNLTETPDILGKQIPREINDAHGLSKRATT